MTTAELLPGERYRTCGGPRGETASDARPSSSWGRPRAMGGLADVCVWSDVASARSIARMSRAELDHDRVGRAAEHMQILGERGDTEAALELARRFRASLPDVPGGWSLLVFGLGGSDGRGVRVSREVLAREALDDETCAYLARFARGDLGTDGDRT